MINIKEMKGWYRAHNSNMKPGKIGSCVFEGVIV